MTDLHSAAPVLRSIALGVTEILHPAHTQIYFKSFIRETSTGGESTYLQQRQPSLPPQPWLQVR